MAREIPEAVRAAAGLAATVLDEARRLPETLPGLPVRVLGLAMQLSMKLQQHYAGLVARGDELLTGIHGEDEPGMATFDEDLPDLPATGSVGTSSFDRVAETIIEVTEDDEADAAVEEALDELAIEELAIEELAEQAGGEDGAAIDTAVDTPTGTSTEAADDAAAPSDPGGSPVGEAAGAPDVDTVDVGTVDVVTPDGNVATVKATVTDEGVAAVEDTAVEDTAADGDAVSGAATDTGDLDTATDTSTSTDTAPDTAPDTAMATDEGGTPVAAANGSPAAGAPVEGYDDWSIAQLRGRLRGYQAKTVAELVSYEEATQAREPYLRMLRNRQEKLDQQAVEASPLAPRGL